MRLIPPKMIVEASLISSLPNFGDTSPIHADLEELVERTRNPTNSPMMQMIVDSGLIEGVSCLPTLQYPKLVLECINRYDAVEKCIRDANGGVLLNVNKETIMVVFKIPTQEAYENWTINTSYDNFSEKKPQYTSVIARNWLLKFQKSGSKLTLPLTQKHMIKEVRDIVILLHKVKRSQHAFFWEDWMYFFIQVILDQNKYIDWASMIADGLHESLSNILGSKNFYMTSYLFY